MAEEPKKSRDFFQWLLEQAVDLIKPALEIFSDPASRSELMASLGLDPSADAPELPVTSNLDAYLASQAEEADPLKFAGAVHELTQLVLAMEAYFHGARAFHEGDEERSGSELVAALLNILSLEFFERKAPGFGSAVNLLNIIGPETIAQGGPDLFKSAVNIAEDAGGSFVAGGPIGLIVDLFVGLYDRLVNSTEDEESTESFSDAFLLIVAILLFYLEEYVIKDESFVLRSGYGFEATRSAQTPNADLLTNRTLSFSITVVDEETPTTQATLPLTTLTPQPKPKPPAKPVAVQPSKQLTARPAAARAPRRPKPAHAAAAESSSCAGKSCSSAWRTAIAARWPRPLRGTMAGTGLKPSVPAPGHPERSIRRRSASWLNWTSILPAIARSH